MNDYLRINEIFKSIDGEVNRWGQGTPTHFIRLQGCNFRCSYCDTTQSQNISGARDMLVKDILEEVGKDVSCKKVTITGGEPLLQHNLFSLVDGLLQTGYKITIETNGSVHIPNGYISEDLFLSWVVDYKFEYKDQMKWECMEVLTVNDWIKFVVDDKTMFEEAMRVVRILRGCGGEARVCVSSSTTEHEWLYDLLMEGGEEGVVLNVQIHKLLNFR